MVIGTIIGLASSPKCTAAVTIAPRGRRDRDRRARNSVDRLRAIPKFVALFPAAIGRQGSCPSDNLRFGFRFGRYSNRGSFYEWIRPAVRWRRARDFVRNVRCPIEINYRFGRRVLCSDGFPSEINILSSLEKRTNDLHDSADNVCVRVTRLT